MRSGVSQSACWSDLKKISGYNRSQKTGAIHRANSSMSRVHRTYLTLEGVGEEVPPLTDREKTVLVRLIINTTELTRHEKVQLFAKLLKENP